MILTGKTLYKHFKKIANGTVDGLYENQLEKNLAEGQRLYTQSLSVTKKNHHRFLDSSAA
jgi:hypothetical protein